MELATDSYRVTSVVLIAVIIFIWGAFRSRHGSVLLPLVARFEPSLTVIRVACIGLVPLYAAQIVLLMAQVHLENGGPISGWERALPIPVYDGRTRATSVHMLLSDVGYAIAVLQMMAVAALALAAHRRVAGVGWRSIVLLSISLATMSLVAPVMSTTDPYEYVASGMLGMKSYIPASDAFKGSIYEPIDAHIPMRGVLYGPLWLAIDTVVTGFGNTIYSKIIAIRTLNLGLTFGLIAILARARAPRSVLIACAVNPAMWFYNVLNPHADIECLIAVATAYAFAQKNKRIAATAFFVVAGIIKLPFIVAGAAAFAPIASARARVALWAVATACTLAISYAIPGPAYLHGIAGYAAFSATSAHGRSLDVYIFMIPICFVIMAAFVFRRKSFLGAAWLFAQLSPLTMPWYLLWGFPYAMATNMLTVFIVVFPLFAAMREDIYFNSMIPVWVFAAALFALVLDVILLARSRVAPALPRLS